MKLFGGQPQPITETLNRAAALLGLEKADGTASGGFLRQAQIIEEIARRVAAVEEYIRIGPPRF
jgi:hypothetical protein